MTPRCRSCSTCTAWSKGGASTPLHSGLGAYGDQEGFVTITPDAHREPAQWALQDEGDVTFMNDLLDRVEGDLCVDRNRVFVTGLSMGGMMSTVLGCAHVRPHRGGRAGLGHRSAAHL